MSIVDMDTKKVIYYASIDYQREMGWSAVPFFRRVDDKNRPYHRRQVGRTSGLFSVKGL